WLCSTPDTSALQCGHAAVRRSLTSVGLSHSGRCAPGWLRRVRVAAAPASPRVPPVPLSHRVPPLGFAACDGGTLAFLGVLAGRPSFASSFATWSSKRL